MKNNITLVILMLLYCLNLNSQTVGIRDFNLPETEASKLLGTFNFSYLGRDTILQGKIILDLNYYKFYSSLPFSYTINADIKESFANDNKNNSSTIQPNISVTIQKYFSDNNKLYLAGSFNSSLNYYSSNFDSPKDKGTLTSDFGVGIGYGRVITATAMAQALRILEYLYSEHLISGEFNKDITIELASHCSKLNEYKTKYGDKHPIDWFMDLEKILVKSGKLIDNRINPYAVFRILEVINRERIYDRPFGWSISGYGNYGFTQYTPNQSQQPFSDYIGYTLSFNLGYPITNKLQFNHFDLYNYRHLTNNYFNQNSVYTQTSLSYNLTNRFDFKLTYSFQSYSSPYYAYHLLSLGTNYYIENTILLNFNASLSKNYGTFGTDLIKSVNMNLGYRFF